MSKKFIVALMALVALAAVALPAAASAQEATLKENGVTLDPTKGECTNVKGTICITATNTDVVSKLTTATGEVLAECTNVSMTGYLEKNTDTAIEGTIHSATFNGTPGVTPHTTHCSSTFGTITPTTGIAGGLPWCLRSTSTMAADEAQIRGGKCSEAARSIKFTLDSSLAGECTYEKTTPVIGTATTSPTAAKVTVEKQEFVKVGGGFLCPAKGLLDLTVSLYTDNAEEKALELVKV